MSKSREARPPLRLGFFRVSRESRDWIGLFREHAPQEARSTIVTPDLHIEILHKEIIVTMPGTSYTVTYYKPKDSRILLAKYQSSTIDARAAVTLSEFLGSAWWTASDKARELGWIA